MARVLINLPRSVRRGEVFEIRTLIQHGMESGYRPDRNGDVVPRDILRVFTCAWNGEEIFRAELSPAIAANPYLSFTTVATESGVLSFTWAGDNGFAQTETRPITVA